MSSELRIISTIQMISAEAPVLFAKAAEMFIHELTMRAWIHTEVFFLFCFFHVETCQMQISDSMLKLTEFQDNKRRTLQRNDIAMAITKYDQFDFLIDIVPRYCFYRIHLWSKTTVSTQAEKSCFSAGMISSQQQRGKNQV